MRSDHAFIRAFLRRGVDDASRVRFETIEPTASGGYSVQSDDDPVATTTVELQADHIVCCTRIGDAVHHRFIDATPREIATVHRFFKSRRYRARALGAIVRVPPIVRMLNACLPRPLRTCEMTTDDHLVVVGRRRVGDERDPIVYTTAIALIDDDETLDIKTWRAFAVVPPSKRDDADLYTHASIPASATDVDALRRYLNATLATDMVSI